MKKHRNEIITGVVLLAILVAVFFLASIRFGSRPVTQENSEFGIRNSELVDDAAQSGSESEGEGTGENSEFGIRNSELTETDSGAHYEGAENGDATSGHSERQQGTGGNSESGSRDSELTGTEPGTASNPGESAGSTGPNSSGGPAQSTGPEKPVVSVSPEQTPQPGETTVMLVISVATVLDNMDKLADGKEGLIPADGIIFSGSVVFYEGESVFNVVQRETKRNRIHMEFVNTPIYNSTYIEGINNIYEFDVGERSGWMYSVNGTFPNFGSSRYLLQDGDVIRWLFTCDRGADIGGGDAADYYGFR